jgi:hypothetical protein
MGRLVALLLSAFFVASVIGTAKAEILIKIDKSSQRMTVSNEGEVLYAWPVSTGRIGHATPSGAFSAFRMDADHYSKEWDDAQKTHRSAFRDLRQGRQYILQVDQIADRDQRAWCQPHLVPQLLLLLA